MSSENTALDDVSFTTAVNSAVDKIKCKLIG